MSTNRIFSFIILIALAAIAPSCKKKLTEFDIDYTSEVTIDSTFGQLIPFSLNTPEIQTNSEFEFENNNTRSDLIDRTNLRELRLDIIRRMEKLSVF